MKIKDKLKKWIYPDVNPSKRIVLKNLNQILQLLESDIATQRIKFLITDIKNDKLYGTD